MGEEEGRRNGANLSPSTLFSPSQYVTYEMIVLSVPKYELMKAMLVEYPNLPSFLMHS